MRQLFSEYANIMYKEYYKNIEKEYYYNQKKNSKQEITVEKKSGDELEESKLNREAELNDYDYGTSCEHFKSLILNNHHSFFQNKVIHQGFKTAFKGNWGAFSHTKKIGAIQPLNRLSYNSPLLYFIF